jgi:hypothetical protein
MTLWRYALVVTTILLASLALVLPLLPSPPASARVATLTGALLAGANTIAAYGLALWSRKRSPTVFLGAVLGGMVGRMAFLLGSVVALVLLLGMPKVPLAISLLGYFVLFLVFELAQLHTSREGQAA